MEPLLAEKFITSKYLVFHQRKDRCLVYHSLFGNLKRLNTSACRVLKLFRKPARIDDVLPLENGEGVRRSIGQFIDSFFLVPEGRDERDLVETRLETRRQDLIWGKMISCLQLCVSDACNLNCKYCFADRSDGGSEKRITLTRRTATEKLMSYETADKGMKAFIDIAKQHHKKRFIVKFFGREPMVNWKVMSRLMKTYKHGEESGIDIRWDLTTNATLIDENTADLLGKYRVNLFVSVDSISDSNDLTRVSKDGGKTFQKIDDAVQMLRKHDVNIIFSAVITNTNFHTFDTRIIDYAKSRGVDTVIVLLAMQNDNLACQKAFSDEDICNRISQLYWYGKEHRINVRGYWHNPLRRLLTMTDKHYFDDRPDKEDLASCSATGFQIAMEPSGDLFPCKAQSHHIGHIDRLEDALRSENYQYQVMRTYMNVKDCKGCEIEGFCQGECLGHSEYKYNDIYTTDPRYCNIYRKITSQILHEFEDNRRI